MNAGMERAMNSENLGARIMENGALYQKIWALKVLGAKQSFQEVLGHFLNVQSSWRAFVTKTGAYAKFGEFLEILVEFWRV
jgi:hypothetical protein